MDHLRGLGGLGIVALVLIWTVSAAYSRTTDVYSVSDIRVDERAGDEVSAKRTGLANGQRHALTTLLHRLTLQEDHGRLPPVDDAMVSRTLRDFSVTDERFGGGRYLASLSARFVPEAVRDILRGADVPFAEIASRPQLLLPVYESVGSTILWDEPNPWFDAWSGLRLRGGLVPLTLPRRDLTDLSMVTAEQAVQGDSEPLRAIAGAYGAHAVQVAVAHLQRDSRGLVLEVAVTQHRAGEMPQSFVRDYRAIEQTEPAVLLGRAAAEIAAEIEDSWKRANLQYGLVEQPVRLFVPLTRLGDWLRVRAKLDEIPAVRRIEVTRMSVREAEVDLAFSGQPDQLQLALAQRDLDMIAAPDRGGWIVRPRP